MKALKTVFSAVIFLIVLGSQPLNAQEEERYYGENPEACKERISIMTTYYKQGAYDDALPSIRKIMEICPQATKNLYIIGEKIYKSKIKDLNKNQDELKRGYADTLIWLYENRIKYFAEEKTDSAEYTLAIGTVLGHFLIKDSMETAYKTIKGVLETHPEVFTPYDIQIFMYNAKFMMAYKKIDCVEMISNYFKVSEVAEMVEESKKDAYDKVLDKATDFTGDCLDCEILDSIYTAKFEKHKTDIEWLNKGIDLLKHKKCTSSDALVLLLETSFDLKEEPETADILAKYYKSTDKEKAVKYYDKAIDLEADPTKKADYMLDKVNYFLSEQRYADAKSLAEKSLEIHPNNAYAYYLIGDAFAYGSSACRDLKFGSKEVYWVAVDYYNKAAANAGEDEEKIKTKAIQNATKYAQYYPEKGDLFLQSLKDGDSYTVDCWINKSTKVRAKK